MNRLRDLLITFVCRLLSVPFSMFSARLFAGQAFTSIIIVKPCCIGDVTLATTALAALREAYPSAHIAFAVSAWARDAIRHNPKIDEILDCGNVGSGRRFGLGEYLALVKRVRRGHYDLAVVLERSPLLSLIPFFAGVPHRAGIDSAGRGFSLTMKAPWLTGQHEASLYLSVVEALGLKAKLTAAEFYPSDEDRRRAGDILDEALNGSSAVGNGRKLALIHPGGAANPGMVLSAKRWFPDRYGAIARRFAQEGWAVLLVGAGSDREAVDSVLESLGDKSQLADSAWIVDLAGRISLVELAALAERCQVFVGNDTGPMHMAAAVGTPTVAIFGPSTPDMYAPRGPRSIAVYNKVSCSPCFVKGRYDSRCRDFKCMQAVGIEDVWAAIEQVLAQ